VLTTTNTIVRKISKNFNTLLMFELLYRVLGLVIIFPLTQLLFHLSIRLSGRAYITNATFLDYLLTPSTISILLVVMFMLSIYITIELIYLSIIFEYGHQNKKIKLKELFLTGLKKLYETVTAYRLRIIGPAFLFFILVELFHVVGIASTINLPKVILDQINSSIWLQVALGVLMVMIIILFTETAFHIHFYVIEKLPTKMTIQESRKLLKGKRLRMMFEFVLLNSALNAVLYVFYMLMILTIGWVVTLIKGQLFTLSIILSIFYSIYIIVGFLATITLIPINFAFIHSWFHRVKSSEVLIEPIDYEKIKISRNKMSHRFKYGTMVVLVVVFSINLVNVFTVLANPKSQIELFNVAEIVAHRGASLDAPENTIVSIELAIEQGADAIEIDVRETREGIPILFHDTTTSRTTDDQISRIVSNMTLEQIKELDVGSWFGSDFSGEQVPTLEEALLIIQGKARIFIELKVNTENINQTVIQLIELYDLSSDVIILSFNKQQLIQIKEINPEIETLLLLSSFYGDIDALIKDKRIDNFGFSEKLFIDNPGYVDAIHQNSKKVYAYTVNNDQKISSVVNNDADGIITDRPISAREIAYSKNVSDLLLEILNRFFKKDDQ